jgi:hypothetical protein
MIQSGDFPEYRTYQDIFRDALVHLLHTREEQAKTPERKAAVAALKEQLIVESKVEQERASIQRVKEILEYFDELFLEYRSHPAEEENLKVKAQEATDKWQGPGKSLLRAGLQRYGVH